MSSNPLANRAQQILSTADVRIGGDRPWDIAVHNPDFYARVFRQGSLGLGESYMDGWWDCPQLDQFFHRIFLAELERLAARSWRTIWLFLFSFLLNPQAKSRSTRVARQHYDLGNDFFRHMLDRRMVYTCGRWERAATLDEAQEAKLGFVCRKLGLEPGMRVLDIGCGWGSFAKYAAERHGAHVVGVTLSRQQVELGREMCADLPVELRLEDYRDVRGSFDRVVSLGMFEHVGVKNYRTFFKVVRDALEANGKLYLSSIGVNRSVRVTDPWIERYIFPNSHLPSLLQIGEAIRGLFQVEEWRNRAAEYDRTLMAWHRNFERYKERVKADYGDRFYRMWRYYLLASAASFRARRLQAWQILLSPAGAAGAAGPLPQDAP
ncbi:MAG TPA: cyclopropane fatty acyl phospholipid synthase [Candidatus Acidoferrales bacterium]|nr:cyclopropane fatty acyl phospholipid synthase [Candidatus Acidoferrales bacterium]